MTEEKQPDSPSNDRRDTDERRVEKRREHDRFVPADAGRSDRRHNERRRDRE